MAPIFTGSKFGFATSAALDELNATYGLNPGEPALSAQDMLINNPTVAGISGNYYFQYSKWSKTTLCRYVHR